MDVCSCVTPFVQDGEAAEPAQEKADTAPQESQAPDVALAGEFRHEHIYVNIVFSTGIWRQLNWDVNICELCFVGVVCEHVFLETSLT